VTKSAILPPTSSGLGLEDAKLKPFLPIHAGPVMSVFVPPNPSIVAHLSLRLGEEFSGGNVVARTPLRHCEQENTTFLKRIITL
jgi:hypothetical protein